MDLTKYVAQHNKYTPNMLKSSQVLVNNSNQEKLSACQKSKFIIDFWMNAICLVEELELRLEGQGPEVRTASKNAQELTE